MLKEDLWVFVDECMLYLGLRGECDKLGGFDGGEDYF